MFIVPFLTSKTFSYFTGKSPRIPNKAIYPIAPITRSIIWIIVEMLVFLLCSPQLVLACNKNRKIIDHSQNAVAIICSLLYGCYYHFVLDFRAKKVALNKQKRKTINKQTDIKTFNNLIFFIDDKFLLDQLAYFTILKQYDVHSILRIDYRVMTSLIVFFFCVLSDGNKLQAKGFPN